MRRKRAGGIWLPPDPYNAVTRTDIDPIQSTDETVIKYATMQAVSTATGLTTTYDFPLIGDFNQDRIAGETGGVGVGAATLVDTRFGYSLKRIVGKLFIGCAQQVIDQNAYFNAHWAVTAGFIVRRTDDVGDPLTIQTSTQSYDSQGDPWIWRRTWFLANQPQSLANEQSAGNLILPWQPGFPQNNVAGLPSALDGPHIDAKTRRTIKQEERLYMHISMCAMSPNADQTPTDFIACWDLRFFGRIFQSAGNRRNASR